MKFLFLNSSPRPNGYTCRAIKCIESYLDAQHKVEWVNVNGLNIKPCISCFKCRK